MVNKDQTIPLLSVKWQPWHGFYNITWGIVSTKNVITCCFQVFSIAGQKNNIGLYYFVCSSCLFLWWRTFYFHWSPWSSITFSTNASEVLSSVCSTTCHNLVCPFLPKIVCNPSVIPQFMFCHFSDMHKDRGLFHLCNNSTPLWIVCQTPNLYCCMPATTNVLGDFIELVLYDSHMLIFLRTLS